MKLDVAALTTDPKPVDAAASLADLGLEEEAALTGPVRFRGSMHRVGAKIHVRGEAAVRARLTCSRCLTEFVQELRADLDAVAVPAEQPGRLRPGDAEAVDQGMVLVYAHERLDLGPEVRTALLLALPMKPLCSTDCPGLCPRCGLLRDGRQCRCGDVRRESPFAILKEQSHGEGDGRESGGTRHGESET